MSARRYRIVALPLFGLLAALACNYGANRTTPQPSDAANLRETLQAIDAQAGEATLPPPPASPPGAETGSPTPAAAASPGSVWDIPPPVEPSQDFDYVVRPGDTLQAILGRFEIGLSQILPSEPLPAVGYLTPGKPLTIANTLGPLAYPGVLLPDSEVIQSPSTLDFDLRAYVLDSGGHLSTYVEQVGDEWLTGIQIVRLVALERSVNPRLLLAFLEFRSHWVLGSPADPEQLLYPIGFFVPGYSGLYKELTLTANHVNIAYYGWRTGEFNRLTFKDGSTARMNPLLNAGSAAVQNIFAKFYEEDDWQTSLYGDPNFSGLYQQMFGDPWTRAAEIEPLLHAGVQQPVMELPFAQGEGWSFTGGPHRTLNLGSPIGALDFGPTSGGPGCAVSPAWVTAPAPGIVTRSTEGIVAIDLDGDGYEQTGWVIFMLHVAAFQRVPAGTVVQTDDHLGHPSCEGGSATGAHVHIARKYNGEWIAADGPLSFILSGWLASAGSRLYQGTLRKGSTVVAASPGGAGSSIIVR